MRYLQKVEQQVQQVIQSHPAIGEIVATEPVILDLLKLAASQTNHRTEAGCPRPSGVGYLTQVEHKADML